MSIESLSTSHLPAPSLPMLSRTLPIRRFLDRLVGDVLAQVHASRGGAAGVVGWPLRLVDVLMLRVHLLNAPFGLDARLEQRKTSQQRQQPRMRFDGIRRCHAIEQRCERLSDDRMKGHAEQHQDRQISAPRPQGFSNRRKLMVVVSSVVGLVGDRPENCRIDAISCNASSIAGRPARISSAPVSRPVPNSQDIWFSTFAPCFRVPFRHFFRRWLDFFVR